MKRASKESVKTKPTRFSFRNLENLPRNKTLDKNIGKLFDIFIRSMIQKAGGNLETTEYWLNLKHEAYEEDDGFWIMHQTYEMADGYTLMNIIAEQMQSKKGLCVDDGTFTLTMRVFTKDESVRGKGSVEISKDRLMLFGSKYPNVVGFTHCLLKAIVIGKLWYDSKSTKTKGQEAKDFRNLTRQDKCLDHRKGKQLQLAKSLATSVGLDCDREEHGFDDLQKIADHLHNICVWGLKSGSKATAKIFEANKGAKGFIPLLYVDNHFDFFVPRIDYVNTGFCFKCNQYSGRRHYQTCGAKCRRCGVTNCEKNGVGKICEKCNIVFQSESCYESHLVKPSKLSLSFCERYEKCKKCGFIHRKDSYSKTVHKCHDNAFCKICRQRINGPHECSHAAPTVARTLRNLEKQKKWRPHSTHILSSFQIKFLPLV